MSTNTNGLVLDRIRVSGIACAKIWVRRGCFLERQIHTLLGKYERGKLTRRELVTGLLALTGAAPAAAQQKIELRPEGIDHLAFRVGSVERSKNFYQEQFGFTVRSEGPGSAFLNAGRQWIALFEEGVLTTGMAPRPGLGLDHYSYQVRGAGFEALMAELKRRGLNPTSPPGTGRIYFPDPDGIIVQLTYSGM